MALQKPVHQSYKLTFEDKCKFCALFVCFMWFCMSTIFWGGIVLERLLTPNMVVDKHTLFYVSSLFIQSLCVLAGFYGVWTSRPGWMLPLLVVITLYTSFMVEHTRLSICASIENFLFRADESYRFNENGSFSIYIPKTFLLLLSSCSFYVLCRTFQIFRAEKKAGQSLSFSQALAYKSFLDAFDKKPLLQAV